ncbi:hypothetical protein K3495_g2500 [Podosphaera aphanis]|nr:hypothetical protein K3495_g2500 [Podosphaera aphanis]
MGPFSHWGCSEQLISNALKKRGYSRCIARKKPPSSAINKQKRLEFAQSNLDWSEEQWSRILWTDETWVSGDSHIKLCVTRKPEDKFDETCIFGSSFSWEQLDVLGVIS